MSFVAVCPFCRRKVQAHAGDLGQSVQCKKCKNYFTLAPQDETPPPEASARAAMQYLFAAKASQATRQAHEAVVAPTEKPAASAATGVNPASPHAETAEHVLVTVPETPSLRIAKQPLQSQPAPAARASWDPFALATLLLGGLALVCAAVNVLTWLTMPLAGAGILAGGVGFVAAPRPSTRDKLALMIGETLSIAVFVYTLF